MQDSIERRKSSSVAEEGKGKKKSGGLMASGNKVTFAQVTKVTCSGGAGES